MRLFILADVLGDFKSFFCLFVAMEETIINSKFRLKKTYKLHTRRKKPQNTLN